ncbi:MAG: HAMP domain-containing protein, partial [Methylococcaceae bacterium]|nr:HAMP domain-containing protein [Methylococcaceae bacterium]
MNSLKRLPIKIFLPVVILVIFLILFFSMMTYQYYAQISNLERTSMSMIKQHLSVLQGELEEEFSEYDSYQYGERAVSAFGVMYETRSLSVIDENNKILLSTKYSWKKQQAEKIIPGFVANLSYEVRQKQKPVIFIAQDHKSIYAYYPLKLLPKIGQPNLPLVGVIFLDYDLSIARALIQNNKLNEAGVFAVVGLLFMGLLISLLNALLARPIQHLSETTLRLAKGELGIQLNEYGQGELAVLGSVFNKMSQQIDGYINKIRGSERNLSITLDSIGDAVIVTNASGKIIRINPVSAKLTGWSVMEAVGKPL